MHVYYLAASAVVVRFNDNEVVGTLEESAAPWCVCEFHHLPMHKQSLYVQKRLFADWRTKLLSHTYIFV